MIQRRRWWCAQLPALVVVVIKECGSVETINRTGGGRRSGQMVVRRKSYFFGKMGYGKNNNFPHVTR